MAVGFPKVPVTPGTPLHFFAMLPLERPQKGSIQLLQNRSLVFSLFSCLSLARLRLLILFFLLMSSSVHPNPDPIFSCFVCAGNVIWRGKSVQCCTCSKWVHLRCSQLSLSKFKALDSSHSWSCPSCCVPTRNTVISSSDSSDMYTSTVQSSHLSANAALPPHPRLQTSYPPMAHFVSSPSAMHSDRTHSRSGILFPDATYASGGVIIFTRQSLSFSELFTSSISSLDPYSDYVGSTSLLTTPPRCHFLKCTPPLFAPLRGMAEPAPFLPPFFLPPEIFSFWGTQLPSSPLDIKRYFRPLRGGSIRLGHLLRPPSP